MSHQASSTHQCPECLRLWNEYAAAALDGIRLQSQLKLAELSRDQPAIDELRSRIHEAANVRMIHRYRLDEHTSKHRVGCVAAAAAVVT